MPEPVSPAPVTRNVGVATLVTASEGLAPVSEPSHMATVPGTGADPSTVTVIAGVVD